MKKQISSNIIQLETVIPESFGGQRLDKVLSEIFQEYSRSTIQTWIRHGQILVNNHIKRPRDLVHGGEHVQIKGAIPQQASWEAQDIALNVVYEDDTLLVINKPVGLVVHPAAGNLDNTLVNALLHHCPALQSLPRAGIVHRLDKNTSGLLVIAKTLAAHTHLVKQLQSHLVKREYEAIVMGKLISGKTIDAPLGRHPLQRKKMAVMDFGKHAVTHFRIIESFPHYTHIRVTLETGRTHQIRAHMAHIRHPVLGDATYGGRLKLPKDANETLIAVLRQFKHQALHAARLGLIHPTTQKLTEWTAPIPEDMQHLLQLLKENKLQLAASSR